MTIGEKIKHIRLEKHLTQKELGEKIGGISQQQIGQWETGKVNPKIETIQKIANALDVDVTELDYRFFSYSHLLGALRNIQSEIEDYEFRYHSEGESADVYKQPLHVLNQIKSELLSALQYKELNQEYDPLYRMFALFNKLNEPGQLKAIDQVEILTKIPEYRKSNPDIPDQQ